MNERTNNNNFMSILNQSNSNIDQILKNDEKRGYTKSKTHQAKDKGKSPMHESEKSMNIHYNPEKAH